MDNKHFMTGHKGNNEFCFPETLNVPRGEAEGNIEVEGKPNSLFPEGPVIKCFVIPPDSKIEKAERLPKPTCSIEKSRQQSFSSQLTKNIDSISSILSSIWSGTAYFVISYTNTFLPGDHDRRTSWRTWATHIWRQTTSLETQNVHIFPFVNLHDMFLQL